MDNMDISNMNDHDLLITLIGEVKSLREEISGMKDDSKEKLNDHEQRLRNIERYGFIAIGILYAIQFYLTYIKQ